jgi:hypothetical protein
MRTTIAILAALLVATGATAQVRGYYGPFTEDDGQFLSSVWSEIRSAERYEDIDWRSVGSNRAPGDRDLQRLMSANWDELKRAQRFEDINWNEYAGEPRTNRYERGRSSQGYGGYDSPFSRDEEAAMSRVWGRIRTAADFDDIDWRSVGLAGAPGSREARRTMARHWGALREAERFEDIDWAATVD